MRAISRFAAMFPLARNSDFFTLPCAGIDWILVGDAAGHVDPITGEGILYALWSSKLAAEAIRRNDLESFDNLWRKEYGNSLREKCAQRDAFYNPLMIELRLFWLLERKPNLRHHAK
jgi:flavin-dependent dehydrogenase